MAAPFVIMIFHVLNLIKKKKKREWGRGGLTLALKLAHLLTV